MVAQKSDKLISRHKAKYPGRNLVTGRRAALLIREGQAIALMRDGDAPRRPLQCLSPYVVHGIGLPTPRDVENYRWGDGPKPKRVPFEYDARCRKCENCLKHKTRLWAARAVDELRACRRSWFVTLTYQPSERFIRTLAAATLAEKAGHRAWCRLSPDQQFRYLAKATAQDLTKFLKRVRKNAGVPLRYLLVCEAHKDGFPHYHLFLHESDAPVRKRVVQGAWTFGWSKCELVEIDDRRAAFYVCKYIAKSALSRVRGSLHYGQPQLVKALTERIEDATRVWKDRYPPPVIGEEKKF